MVVRLACLLAVVGGCTAIRPLDPIGADGAHALDAAVADAASDAFADDTGIDASAPDAGVDGGTDASRDAPSSDAGRDTNCPLETCGGGDEDCDGMIDEADAIGAMTFYPDMDGDGYGVTALVIMACRMPVTGHWATRGGDCDDTNRQVSPGRGEQNCNGRDDDCNGIIDDSAGVCGMACRSAHSPDGHSYLFCPDTRTQASAASACAGFGYHLADIADSVENDFVCSSAVTLGVTGSGSAAGGLWIGLMQTAPMASTYRWTDGSTATYFAWDPATSEPNQTGTCVRIKPMINLWGDSICTLNNPYVCEAP